MTLALFDESTAARTVVAMGEQRSIPLRHGDVAVWGGVDRLRFHGVHPLKKAVHQQAGAHRFKLILRRAG